MTDILYPALAIGAIALLLGGLLAFASIVFKVETDEREEKIAELLPGANCGGCGCAGCSAFASAIVSGAEITRCNLMTDAKLNAIAEVMGVKAGKIVKKTAKIACRGTCTSAKNKYEYYGIADCTTACQLGGGAKECAYGCLGLGSCVGKCAYGALSIVDGVATVDKKKCVGCGACASVCPKGIIKIIEVKNTAFVECSSAEKGAITKKACSVGCIGCKICEKKCEYGAIKVENNLATVDFDKCTACGACAEACPQKIIKMM